MKLFGSKHGKYEGRHTSPRRRKRRSTKSLLPLCLVLILGVCLTVGGTLAFMQQKTDTVTNTFKAGDITYTLNLEANAENVEMPSELKAQSSTSLSATFTPDKAPTKTGYTFGGWYYDTACTDAYPADQISGDSIVVKYGDKHDQDKAANKVEITLYAKWTPNTYEVAYNGNGATSGNMANSQHTYDVATNLTANAYSKTGYTFTGWNTNADGSGTGYTDQQSVMNLTAENDATVTLYAQWKANGYTIKYDANTGAGTMEDTEAQYDQEVTLRENSFTKTGYIFTGWNTKPDGTGDAYADKATVKNLVTEDDGEITLYAQWKMNTYIVHFNNNGGTGTMADQTFTYDVSDYLRENLFTRTGYEFLGWATSSDSQVAEYYNEQYVKNLTDQSEITLYAVWSADAIVVTFESGYADAPASPLQKTVIYDQAYGTLATAPEIEGYRFLGWYTEKEGKGQHITTDTIVKINKNHTLYAHWETPDIDFLLMFPGSGNNNFESFIKHDYTFNEGITYTGQTISGRWESFSIRIQNLVPGGTYRLKFDAAFSDRTCIRGYSNVSGNDNANYPIGCTVAGESSYAENGDTGGSDLYDWKPTNANKSTDDFVIEFVADEDGVMFWLWELSRIRNPGEVYKPDWVSGKENFEESYFDLVIDDVELTLVDAYFDFGSTAARTTNSDGTKVGNFKINSSDTDSVNFNYKGAAGLYEKVRVPINGLLANNMYTVEYKFIPGTNATYKSFVTETKSMSNNYSNTGTQVTGESSLTAGDTVSGSFSFKATASTMYWLWDMTSIPNGEDQAYKIEATIKYDPSATPTSLILDAVPMTSNITLVWDGIDDTNMDIWYPVDEQYPVAGDSYELAFEPSEGYAMAETITVTIDDATYVVYTNGQTEDGVIAPVYDPEANVLSIPAELLTTETTYISVTASAVPVDIIITTEQTETTETESAETEATVSEAVAEEATITVAMNLTSMTAQGDTTLQVGEDYSVVLVPDDGYQLPEIIRVEIDGTLYEVYTDGLEHRELPEDETELPPMPTFDPATGTLTIPAVLLGETTENVAITVTAVEIVAAPAETEGSEENQDNQTEATETSEKGTEDTSEPAPDNTVSTGDAAVLPPDNKEEDTGDDTDGGDDPNTDGMGSSEETTITSEEVAE